MEIIGTVVVNIIMACALAGAVMSALKPESPLGKEFVAGIDSIGPIFLCRSKSRILLSKTTRLAEEK